MTDDELLTARLTSKQLAKANADPAYRAWYLKQIAKGGSGKRTKLKLTTSPAPPRPRIPTPEELPCVHRGEELEWLPCKPCRSAGKMAALTYGCELHDQCTMHPVTFRDAKHNLTVIACVGCRDRQPADPQADP